MRYALVLMLALAAGVDAAAAYTHVIHEQRSTLVRLAWPSNAQTIRFDLNDRTGARLPNVTPGSDPRRAIERALATWPAVSAIDFRLGATTVASAGRDGDSIISFADTSANAAQFEMAGEPIGLTLYFFEDEALIEADVLFNPRQQFTTTAGNEDEIEAQEAADVEAVAVHELGHAIGLNHSGVESASMWGFTSLAQRELDPDDIAGARALYPQGIATATLAGSVRVGGLPAFGAHVVAVSADGPVVSTLTLPDGTYRMESLPPGSYTAYAEPLDGPHGSAFIDGCVRIGNMGGGGIFDAAELTVNFATAFYGGNGTPVELTLTADQIVLADFDLAAGTSALNPVRVGPALPSGAFSRLAEFPLTLNAGATEYIAIAGPGLERVDGVGIAGAGVTVDASSVQRPDVSCGGAEFPTMIFPVTVAVDAIAGGRTLLVTSGDDLAAFTGAIEILATDAAPECVGDCDSSGVITVAELVRGVNISLDRAALDTCANFDRDGNQRVTVDELVAGVNGLLLGCTSPGPIHPL